VPTKNAIESQLYAAIKDRALFAEGARVLIAVSGGADSVCLLHALHFLSRNKLSFELVVAHLDHGLRAESMTDAQFVADMCTGLDLPCHVERVDVMAIARKRKQGVEEAGRTARRQFLQRIASEHSCERIALAHHRDDQAETVLLRMARGSGISGLAAMLWRDGPFIRPLLGVTRRQIDSYLHQLNIDFVEDASNSSLVYMRNRIRHQVLPQLRQVNPGISKQLAQLASLAQLENSYWQQQLAELMPSLSCWYNDQLHLDCQTLIQLHPALQLRVVRAALEMVRGDLLAIETVHLEAVVGLLNSGRPQRELSLPRAWVARRYGKLLFSSVAPQPCSEFSCNITAPGTYDLPDGRLLRVTLEPEGGDKTGSVVEFAADHVAFPLCLRSVRPGDRITSIGMSGRKKVKKIFAERRMELEQRYSCLVLARGDDLLWLLGVHRCAEYRPDGDNSLVIRCEIEQNIFELS